MKNLKAKPKKYCLIPALLCLCGLFLTAGGDKALVLQEMTWTDVEEYIKTNDMVIIPIGSTEQHGPHMPLGTDFYEAFETCKLISQRTGVVVAPVVMAGYSVYHSGFTGSLSLKTETLAQVLFETAQMLTRYGFDKIMFFNYHGGNRTAEQLAVHRINHETEAVAVTIGIGSPIHTESEPQAAPFDTHAGINETSVMLYLKPELVHMDRAQKPEITYSPKIAELAGLIPQYPELGVVLDAFLGIPADTGKGGASHELSSNGVWSFGDPNKATRERGERVITRMVDAAVQLIESWKLTG